MKLLITGGAGFLGARLARTLLAKGTLAGQKLTQVVLADQFPAPCRFGRRPPRSGADRPVVGPMRWFCPSQV
jgi:D-erythronate 2-dehydrogenase